MGSWFPTEGSKNDPEWWGPIERVAALTQRTDRLPTIAACEFMFMGREEQAGRSIWLYKHVALRTYLNVCDEGQAFYYWAPEDLDRDGYYIGHDSLSDALEALGLHELSTAWRYERCRDCEVCATAVFPVTDGQVVY